MESDWHKKKIGDISNVTDFVANGSFAALKDNVQYSSIPDYAVLVRLTDSNSNWKKDFVYVSEKSYKFLKKSCLETGDVIISNVGANAGTVFRVPDLGKPVTLGPNSIVIKTDGNNVLRDYIYYFFTSYFGQALIGTIIGGSAQPKFNKTDFRSLQILLPKEEIEQKAIAHILGSFDDKIEINQQMNETLEAMAQALFKSWFVDFDPVIDNALAAGNAIPDVFVERAELRRNTKQRKTGGVDSKEALNQLFPDTFEFTEEMGWIPKGWESVKLNELLEVKYGKDHKKLEEGNIPVYGSGGLMRLVNKSLYIGESILIPRKGTLSNLMFVDEEFWTVDTMFFSIPKLKQSAKYLFHQLKLLDFTSMNVGSAVPSMTTKVLNDLNILKPQDNVLEEFDSLVTDYFNREKSLSEESNSLSKLRDTLLPKLLSGEFRIPDAEKLIQEAL